MIRKLSAVFMLSVVVSGCATLFSGTTQPINISTTEPGVSQCNLRDKGGRSYSVLAPGVAVVSRGDGPLTVSCEMPGFTGQRQVAEELEPLIILNLLWGLASPVAAGIDAVSGAYQQYPDNNRVQMVPTSLDPAAAPFSPKTGL